jgi:GntR family transcriptional regulator / MocR family aminotransferase
LTRKMGPNVVLRKNPQTANIMEPIFELPISLPARGSRDLLRAVHGQLRAAILDGRLQGGLRLPPTRTLAAKLGVSRNTALAAYDLLLSEGYLVAKAGAGTYVAALLPQRTAHTASKTDSTARGRLAAFWRAPPALPAPTPSYRFDFRTGLPDKTSFPFHVWRRLSARALRALSKVPAAYAEPEGRPELRDAIAKHVSFARAVACRPEDVVVTAGAQQALDLIARVLVVPGQTTVAVEDPGYPPMRSVFAAAGAKLAAIPVDDEGLVVDRLPPTAHVICVTPSHQFPLGVAMSLRRRTALLDFARTRRAVVIEDDYDGEFRFGGKPLDALQTLDRAELVFYVGTFSKSLFPALRLGFVVAPTWAKNALLAAKQLTDWHGPVLSQDTLGAFIGEGHLARHVRKMRKVYGARRATLLRALARHCGDRLAPIPAAAGLHVAAHLAGDMRAGALEARAAAAGVGLESLDRYALGKSTHTGAAFGYGLIQADQIDEAVRRLAQAMD